jgi:serine/threonine-protein kinase
VQPDQVIQLGLPPYRIDIMTSISGVVLSDAWPGRLHGTLFGVPVAFIGREEFLRNLTDAIQRLSGALADRYRIERDLGAGGMATVYLATDLRHNRKVALKVMRPELAATMGSTRFLREIQTAAQLQHPHILPLHDSGESDGFLWFVMPYVEANRCAPGWRARASCRSPRRCGCCATWWTRSPMRTRMAWSIATSSPTTSSCGRHAMVTDLGVAKAVDEATGRNALTTAGVALGTPTYMAPE